MNIVKIPTLLLCLFMLAATGCDKKETNTSSTTAQPKVMEKAASAEDLANKTFALITVDSQPVTRPEGAPDIFLTFGEDMHVSSRICNTFMGQAVVTDGLLTASPLASTRMLCPDDEGNELETIFPELLQNGAKVSIFEDTLLLRGNGHELKYTESKK